MAELHIEAVCAAPCWQTPSGLSSWGPAARKAQSCFYAPSQVITAAATTPDYTTTIETHDAGSFQFALSPGLLISRKLGLFVIFHELMLTFSFQAVEYEGWADVFFLTQFILSCIMGWERHPYSEISYSFRVTAAPCVTRQRVVLQVCSDVFYCAVYTVQLGANHHHRRLHQGTALFCDDNTDMNCYRGRKWIFFTLWQNVLVTYIGMVFSGDYIFSWTNFIGLNIRYEPYSRTVNEVFYNGDRFTLIVGICKHMYF